MKPNPTSNGLLFYGGPWDGARTGSNFNVLFPEGADAKSVIVNESLEKPMQDTPGEIRWPPHGWLRKCVARHTYLKVEHCDGTAILSYQYESNNNERLP